jgi:hypothetical protein
VEVSATFTSDLEALGLSATRFVTAILILCLIVCGFHAAVVVPMGKEKKLFQGVMLCITTVNRRVYVHNQRSYFMFHANIRA